MAKAATGPGKKKQKAVPASETTAKKKAVAPVRMSKGKAPPRKAAPKGVAPKKTGAKSAPPPKMAAAKKGAMSNAAPPKKTAAKKAAPPKRVPAPKKAAPPKNAAPKAAPKKAAPPRPAPAKTVAVKKAAPRRVPAKVPVPATRRARTAAPAKRPRPAATAPRAVAPAPAPTRPPQTFTVSHLNEEDFKADGLRAYALYRDLGIAAATAGLCQAHVIRFVPPTTDEVRQRHTHSVDLQLIYVLKGWIKNEFEGHGPQMMSIGSCWLQPSGLQHTVLEYSPDCEVLEIIIPADFKTDEVL
jgi:hypothetical protein